MATYLNTGYKLKTVKLDVEGMKLTMTGDHFWKLTYSGVNKFGDYYEVSHEIPYGSNSICSDINSLIQTVLSEASQLHGR